MAHRFTHIGFKLVLIFVCCTGVWSTVAWAANEVTIATVTEIEPGQTAVRVDIYAHNESHLLEYFNLIEFDDTRLEFVSMEADRGGLWYGYYPTHVDGNRIYVHGSALGSSGNCINPDIGYPGAALFHLVFNVKAGAADGRAALVFLSESPWDGHWNNCSGYQINPTPDYADGGIVVDSGSSAVGDGLPDETLQVLATGTGAEVRFFLGQPGPAAVTVYDLRGRQVQRLDSRLCDAGWQVLSWRGRDDTGRTVASGAYLVLVTTENESRCKVVTLTR